VAAKGWVRRVNIELAARVPSKEWLKNNFSELVRHEFKSKGSETIANLAEGHDSP
jgi:hypothetical protein